MVCYRTKLASCSIFSYAKDATDRFFTFQHKNESLMVNLYMWSVPLYCKNSFVYKCYNQTLDIVLLSGSRSRRAPWWRKIPTRFKRWCILMRVSMQKYNRLDRQTLDLTYIIPYIVIHYIINNTNYNTNYNTHASNKS